MTKIYLQKYFFTEKEKTIFEEGQFKAIIYEFETGMHAIKLCNSVGYIIVLPYYGQMVWDAFFEGRSLVMKTLFDKDMPKYKSSFLDNYGCYIMHCGARRNGCPSQYDTHPLHGELPAAIYDSAAIIAGDDENGNYIGVTGLYEYNQAFGDKYLAHPCVKIYEDSGLLHVSIEINNLTGHAMDLMYMLHINNCLRDSGRIVQTSGWTPDDMQVRTFIPEYNVIPDGFREFMNKIALDPSYTRTLNIEDDYNPEICIEMCKYKKDNEGFAYAMQVHPDGTADLVKFKPDELPVSQRWICTTLADDQRKIGIALPGTCGTEGYLAEKHKGRIRKIQPFESFKTTVIAGYLDAEQTKRIENHIKSMSI